MRSTAKPLVCTSPEHREATFVCQHLGTGGVGLGFHRAFNPDDPDELWPAAWCDACEEALRGEGWSDRVHELADLRLLCVEHYDLVRRRNWRQDDAAYENLARLAMAYLQRRQAELHERFPLGDRGSFSFDNRSGEATFSGRRSAGVVARFQVVGNLSHPDGVWTWSWASPSEPESVKDQIRKVRAHGEKNSYRLLASATWQAGETDAWAMTAIAAYLLGAEGASRVGYPDGATFMVMHGMRWMD